MPDTIDTAAIEARVRAGAQLLDDCDPGCINSIDLDRLDMGSCALCVLGQRYGSYDRGVLLVSGVSRPGIVEWAVDHGFCVMLSIDGDGEGYDSYAAYASAYDGARAKQLREYAELSAAWRALITERRTRDAH